MGVSAAAAADGVHGFPAELTSFVGRDGSVRAVSGLLERNRLVTVTGPGGAGKTRLAGQVARRAAGRFADGAWLAELALVGDPGLVAAVVAAALGVREQPGVPPTGALQRALARRQLLLDNCEPLIRLPDIRPAQPLSGRPQARGPTSPARTAATGRACHGAWRNPA